MNKYNDYYGDNERIVYYSKGVAPKVPPWDMYIDLLLLSAGIIEEEEKRKKQLDMQLKSLNNKYKGVYFNKRKKKWCATIRIDKKSVWLGSYKTKDEAFEAYKQAVKEKDVR